MVSGDKAGGGPQEGRLAVLEQEGRFPELATELATLVNRARGTERAALLARLGEVRLRLDDVARAISAFRESLETDPKQAVSRRWLEAMLAEAEHALEAAEVLGPIYETEFRSDAHSATMLLAVLELRAGKAPDEDERIATWVQLGAYFDQTTVLPAERQREISQRMLRRTAVEWPGGVPKWIERVVRSGDPAFRAEAMRTALDQPKLAPSTAQELAFAAAEALDDAGRTEEALAAFERALETDPSSPEVVARIDSLASRAGESVEQRMGRYRTAIENAAEPERRASLRYALGVLVDGSLSDAETAMDLWKLALSEVPTLMRAHEALIAGYAKTGNDAAIERELERALSHLTGSERRGVLLRLAELLASRGELARAIERSRELLRDATFEDPALYVVERFGEEAKDLEVVRAVYERRVEVAPERMARAHALEGLAQFESERLGDKAGASDALRAAAELWLVGPEDVAEAERLYQRALEVSPSDKLTALRVLDLRLSREEWEKLPEAFRLLSGATGDPREAVQRVLALESRFAQAGALGAFARTVDEVLGLLDDSDVANARALLGAKASILARAGHVGDAAEIYENLIEAFCDEEDVRAYVGLVESCSATEFRHQKRRWLLEWRTARAADPVAVLVHWALVEEQEFNDVPAAMALLERAIQHDPKRAPVHEELARLRLGNNDLEGTVEALASLREIGGGRNLRAVELALAELLVERLNRPEDALPVLASLLARVPGEPTARALALGLVERTSHWLEASDVLERALAAETGPGRQELLAALLRATDARAEGWDISAELRTRRRAWYEQLLQSEEGQGALEAMERAAAEFPEETAIWDAVETLAVRLSDAGAAVRAYDRAIRRTRDAGTAETLGRRLVAFADQHVDNPRLLGAPLEAMLALVPSAGWAFDRVKFALGSEQRWSALFPLYEQKILVTSDDAERAALLDEAAIAARDVAAEPDRAIRYWEQYFRIRPDDERVDLALERLYERQRALAPLIQHLELRASSLAGDDRARLEERIAGLHVERGDARAALWVLEKLPGSSSTALLERVFSLPFLEGDEEARHLQSRAAKLLRERYASAGRTKDVARIVRAELGAATERGARIDLLRKLGELERALGDTRAEFDVLGQLLALEPAVDEYRERLSELADELDARERLSELIVLAAEATDDRELFARLLFDAARLVLGLSDGERAIAIHTRVLSECERREHKLEAARELERLLLRAGRPAERCAVLERIAELEDDAVAQKRAWSEAARVALEELGDAERASKAYRMLLEREPGSRELHEGLIRSLAAARRHDELATALEARAALEPGSPAARRDLAELARLLSSSQLLDRTRAIAIWRSIRAEYGADSESFEALSGLFEAEKRWDELAALLSDEAENARVKGPLFQRLAAVHRMHTGDLRAALDAFVRAEDVVAAGELIAAYPMLLSDDPSLTLELSSKLERASRLPEAEAVLRKQLEHYGPRRPNESVRVHLRLADLLRSAGKREQARAELLSATERHPSSAEVQAALAESEADGGDYARAEQSYRSLLLLPSRSGSALARAEIYLRLGDLSARRGDAQAAEDHVASAFESALGNDEEAIALERALRDRGRQDLLERAITARLERTREPSKVLVALSDLLEANAVFGETDPVLAERALKLADRSAKELESSETGPAAFWPLVAVYDKLGQNERAIAALEQIAARAATAEERDGYALEVTRRLFALPGRREDGLARLWDLVRRDPSDEARCELLLAEARDGKVLDELIVLIDEQAALAEQRHDLDRLESLSVRRATALERAGRLPEALAAYQRLAKSSPRRWRALGEVVRLLEALDGSKSELADAREALLEFETGPVAAGHAAELAALRREQGDRAGLERALERGFLADPARADVRDELFRLLTEGGRFERLAELLESAIKTSPDDGLLRLRLAQAYRAFGAAPQALATLDAALAAGASESEVRRERAAALEAVGRFDAALVELDLANSAEGGLDEELFQAIVRTNAWKESERWALRAADLAADREKRARARQILELWAEKQPDNSAVLSKVGRLASLDRDFPVSIAAFRKLTRLERGLAQRSAALALARVCEAAGRPQDAIPEVERALAEGADTAELRRELGKLYAQSGARAKQARLLLDEAKAAKAPARAELLGKAAELFVAEAAFDEASDAIDQLVAEDPDRLDAVVLRARVLAGKQGAAEGRRFLERNIADLKKRDRRHSRLFRVLAELHLADDELAEALAPLSQAHQLDKSDAEVAFTLGLVAFDLDQLDLAATSLRGFLATKESASTGPQLSRAYFVLACIEHAKGQRTVARRMASRALEVDSSNDQARRFLGTLG